MTAPTPKETVLHVLHNDLQNTMAVMPLGDWSQRLREAIAWVNGLQAESDERAVRAFVRGVETGFVWGFSDDAKAEAEARRLLAEGKL